MSQYCNFYYSLLGIETIGASGNPPDPNAELQFLLLPIRDWNNLVTFAKLLPGLLQFLLLPIRDWNLFEIRKSAQAKYCNFYYSLLGIETVGAKKPNSSVEIAISITPY